MKFNQDLYFPLALRIIKEENERRIRTNSTNPLEIIFYSNYWSDTRPWDALLNNLQPNGKNVRVFGTWTKHPLFVEREYWYNTKEKYSDYYSQGEYYFNILGGRLSAFDCTDFEGFIQMQTIYRIGQSPRKDRCLINKYRFKTFQKPDELFGLINSYICKNVTKFFWKIGK